MRVLTFVLAQFVGLLPRDDGSGEHLAIVDPVDGLNATRFPFDAEPYFFIEVQGEPADAADRRAEIGFSIRAAAAVLGSGRIPVDHDLRQGVASVFISYGRLRVPLSGPGRLDIDVYLDGAPAFRRSLPVGIDTTQQQ